MTQSLKDRIAKVFALDVHLRKDWNDSKAVINNYYPDTYPEQAVTIIRELLMVIEKQREGLLDIADTPHSMVNDSLSLRWSLQCVNTIAVNSLPLSNQLVGIALADQIVKG